MPDTSSAYTPPPVQDKRLAPPGILPKNIQSWVLIGIAVVMIVIIAFSGNPSNKPRPTTQARPVADPNAERIQEYQKRIEDETRKLQIEQVGLARTQAALGPAIPASQGSLPGTYRGAVPLASAPAEPNPQKESLRMDQEKREYESLFASNVAFSNRPGQAVKPAVPGAAPPSPLPTGQAGPPLSDASLAKLLPFYIYASQAASQAGAAQSGPTQLGSAQPASSLSTQATAAQQTSNAAATPDSSTVDQQTKRRAEARAREFNAAEGKEYRLLEGTVLETVLTNRLDGSFSGPVNCMVTTNVYSHNGRHILIPQGSRVLGEVRKVESFGQQRLAVYFHRLIMPDGYSLSLDKFQGLSQVGETGLRDQINHHYLEVFGVSVAIGAIAGLGQANIRSGVDQSGLDTYQQGVATSLSQSSLRILDRYLNVLPTFTIREGLRVKVYLAGDLDLPAYDKHQVPGDL